MSNAPRFDLYIEHLNKKTVEEVEQIRAAGPQPATLAEWNLTTDEWQLAVERALEELRR